jgi:hypothetical protein
MSRLKNDEEIFALYLILLLVFILQEHNGTVLLRFRF